MLVRFLYLCPCFRVAADGIFSGQLGQQGVVMNARGMSSMECLDASVVRTGLTASVSRVTKLESAMMGERTKGRRDYE